MTRFPGVVDLRISIFILFLIPSASTYCHHKHSRNPESMIHGDPAVILDQLAQLQTQILSLQQQNTALQTRNVQLGEELECTKSELRETQALLGQAVLRVNQQPQVFESVRLNIVALRVLTGSIFYRNKIHRCFRALSRSGIHLMWRLGLLHD